MKPFKLKITHQGKTLHEPSFDTLEELKEHRVGIESMGLQFNFPTKQVLKPAWVEEIAATDEVPAHQIQHPEEMVTVYDIEIFEEDKTLEIKAEKQTKEAKKLAKEKRKDDRKKLDWSKVNSVAELKAIVKSLAEELED